MESYILKNYDICFGQVEKTLKDALEKKNITNQLERNHELGYLEGSKHFYEGFVTRVKSYGNEYYGENIDTYILANLTKELPSEITISQEEITATELKVFDVEEEKRYELGRLRGVKDNLIYVYNTTLKLSSEIARKTLLSK